MTGLVDLSYVLDYLDKMIKDGWEVTNLYDKDDPYYKTTKEGFVMHVNCREKEPFNQSRLAGWGPDGLTLALPMEYSFDKFEEALRVCASCGKEDVDVFRKSFAGRSCTDCLQEYEIKTPVEKFAHNLGGRK